MNTNKLILTIGKEKYLECHAIIHAASAGTAAVGAGLAQIPLSDSAVITPIQVSMITALGRVFDIELTDSMARAGLAAATAGVVGRAASQVLIGWIPGVGNAVNAATAASITESIGWFMVKDFAREYCLAS